jgi:hypothetical protein
MSLSVTLSDEQAKNLAATLRNMANVLDPAVTPTPEPTPNPTPAPQPTYPGFSASPIFQEYFDTDCVEGEFASKHRSRWALCSDGWQDTSKKRPLQHQEHQRGRRCGHNPPVHFIDGGLARCLPAPGLSAQPKINSSTDLYQLYGRYEYRMKADAVSGTSWRGCSGQDQVYGPEMARSTFPNVLIDRQADLNGGTVSAIMRRQNGTSGSDQDHFGSAVTLGD